MCSQEIIIRDAEPRDERRIVELLIKIFSGWPAWNVESPLMHWRWKFRDNPVHTRNFVVAENRDEIIGVFGLLSHRLKIKDRDILCNTGVDVGVDPGFRGMGVYSSLREYANEMRIEEGYDFSYGIESNPQLIKAHEKRGDQGGFPFTARRDFKIFDIEKHFEDNKSKYVWVKKIGFNVLSIITSLKNRLSNNQEVRDVTFTDSCSDSQLGTFLKKVVAEHDFIFQRSLEDFRWRYRDPRGGEYTVKYAAKDNEIIGYVVLGEKIVDNYPVGYIVELISLQEFSLVQDRLIGEAVEYFRERRVNLILFLSVSGKSMEHFLRRHMFVPGEPLYLTYTLGMYDEDLLKWEPFLVDRVHFCYGDFDYI